MQKRVNSVQRSDKRDRTIHMIFLVLFGTNKHLYIFQRPHIEFALRARVILLVFEKIYSCLFQISLEIKWFSIQTEAKLSYCAIHSVLYNSFSRFEKRVSSFFVSYHANSCLSRILLSKHFPFLCFSLCSQVVLLAEINYLWL